MKILKVIQNNLFNIFLVILIGFFIYTGKFNIIIAKFNAYMGEGKGEPVPEVMMTDITTNETIQLSKLKGKVVLINFWATWCPPCRVEIPSFVELYEKYNKQGLVIIGVSLDQGGIQGVKDFVKKEKIPYPITMYNGKTMASFGEIVGVPTSVLINPEGKIEAKYPGFYLKSSFESEIVKLLKK